MLVGAGVYFAVVSRASSSGLPLAPFGIVGYVVARRQPRNPIGWILLALGLVFLLASDGGAYSFMAYRQGYHLPFAGVGGLPDGVVDLGGDASGRSPFALFPDGRVSRGWRRIVLATSRSPGRSCGLDDLVGQSPDRCPADPGRLDG